MRYAFKKKQGEVFKFLFVVIVVLITTKLLWFVPLEAFAKDSAYPAGSFTLPDQEMVDAIFPQGGIETFSEGLLKRSIMARDSGPRDLVVRRILEFEKYAKEVRTSVFKYMVTTEAYKERLKYDDMPLDEQTRAVFVDEKARMVALVGPWYYYDSENSIAGFFDTISNKIWFNVYAKPSLITVAHEYGHATDHRADNPFLQATSSAFVKGALTAFALKRDSVRFKNSAQYLQNLEGYVFQQDELRANLFVLRYVAFKEKGLAMDKEYSVEDVKMLKKYFKEHPDPEYRSLYLMLFAGFVNPEMDIDELVKDMLNGVADIKMPGDLRHSS